MLNVLLTGIFAGAFMTAALALFGPGPFPLEQLVVFGLGSILLGLIVADQVS